MRTNVLWTVRDLLVKYVNWYGLLVIGLSSLVWMATRARAADQLLPPDPPGPVVVGPAGRVAAGDTLIYTIRWGPGARATGYLYTMSAAATNGTWSIAADSNGSGKFFPLPPALPYTCPTNCVTWTWLKMWLTAVPWDSATFTFTVASQNAVGVSASIGATWRVLRKPGVPGPIVVDSSLIVTGVLIRPPTMSLAVGQTKRICAYPQFGNGAIATQTGATGCDSLRVSLWMLPSAPQQAHTDSMCFVWASSNTAVATITSPPCALGMRPDLIWKVASR